jgi:hypothetical protein
MKGYLLEKLSDINFRIATHEGDAMKRLSSESHRIQLLPEHYIPIKYKKEFNELLNKIENTVISAEGRVPIRIKGINSHKKAVQYIQLLINIEDQLTYDNELK